MINDPATWILWIRGCLWIAAVCTTAFPLLYLFSPWYGSYVGRGVMVQSVSFALAMDITLLFQYWLPELYIRFWINALVLSFIAGATAYLTAVLWRANYKHRKRIKEIFK